MTEENYTLKKRFDTLKKEVVDLSRKDYLCKSNILDSLADLSKSINDDLKTLHEGLIKTEGVFEELNTEDSLMLEAMEAEEISKMLDSTSCIIDQVSAMSDYITTIFEDISKVLPSKSESEN